MVVGVVVVGVGSLEILCCSRLSEAPAVWNSS